MPPNPPSPRPAAPSGGFPLGLVIVLGAYGLLVLGYVWQTYWSSPEYQAAKHSAQAIRLLGVDDGRKCSPEELLTAFDHLLEAARLTPGEHGLAEHAERLRWRFDERKLKLDVDRVRRAEAVAALARRAEQEQQALLVVGARERGWAADQLLEGPTRVLFWSVPGAGLIVALWAFLRFSGQAARRRAREADLQQTEREVQEAGRFREGLKNVPAVVDAPKKPRAKPKGAPR